MSDPNSRSKRTESAEIKYLTSLDDGIVVNISSDGVTPDKNLSFTQETGVVIEISEDAEA